MGSEKSRGEDPVCYALIVPEHNTNCTRCSGAVEKKKTSQTRGAMSQKKIDVAEWGQQSSERGALEISEVWRGRQYSQTKQNTQDINTTKPSKQKHCQKTGTSKDGVWVDWAAVNPGPRHPNLSDY